MPGALPIRQLHCKADVLNSADTPAVLQRNVWNFGDTTTVLQSKHLELCRYTSCIAKKCVELW
jgi:hypothetical protein